MKISRIDRDLGRFRDIVRGRVKRSLRKYISHSEMIGRKGKDLVSIPVPQIDLPHFRFGEQDQGGVGWNDAARATRSVTHVGRDHQDALAADLHAGKDDSHIENRADDRAADDTCHR